MNLYSLISNCETSNKYSKYLNICAHILLIIVNHLHQDFAV
jgi:hypothetical protein